MTNSNQISTMIKLDENKIL